MKKELVLIPGIVKEMSAKEDDFSIDVPINGIDVAQLTEGDENPMFVTIEALNEGVSKNKINYTRPVIQEIARQVNINKPDAYMGHLKDDEIQTKNPSSQTIWLGAVTKEIDGKLRMFIKGYVMPYATELKTYIKKAKSAKKKVSVSIFALSHKIVDAVNKVYELDPTTIVLESIDWARSGGAGVATLGHFQVTKEMAGEVYTREEIIAGLTRAELEMINPEIVKEMRGTYLLEIEPEVKKQVVKEMISQITILEKDNLALRKTNAENCLDRIITGFPDNAKKLIRKMVIAEMKPNDYTEDKVKDLYNKVINSDEGLIIREMTSTQEVNVLKNNRKNGNSSSFLTVKKK